MLINTVSPDPREEQDWQIRSLGKGTFALYMRLPRDCFTGESDVYVNVAMLILTRAA
jgi:hypothetical protein